jgi:hypothetical protein
MGVFPQGQEQQQQQRLLRTSHTCVEMCTSASVMLTAVLPLGMPQEKERKIEELRARRKDHIRTVLMSQNFLLGAGWSLSQGAATPHARDFTGLHSQPSCEVHRVFGSRYSTQ